MMVYQHHERLDGSGYPAGITGEEMHPWARICAVADVFDALTCQRPYRRAVPLSEACDYLQKHAGKWFDAEAVDVLGQSRAERGAMTDVAGPVGMPGPLPAGVPSQPVESDADFFAKAGPLPTAWDEARRHPRFYYRAQRAGDDPPLSAAPQPAVQCSVLTRDLSRGGLNVIHTEQLFPGQRIELLLLDGVRRDRWRFAGAAAWPTVAIPSAAVSSPWMR